MKTKFGMVVLSFNFIIKIIFLKYVKDTTRFFCHKGDIHKSCQLWGSGSDFLERRSDKNWRGRGDVLKCFVYREKESSYFSTECSEEIVVLKDVIPITITGIYLLLVLLSHY